jgi:PAS domain S-box-containing protein
MANKPSYDELERKIGEMKVVEAKLRQNEEKYRNLLETLNEALYQMSIPEGTYDYVSPSIQKIFGYTDKQLYANPLLIQEIIHPDFHTYFQEKWTDLLAGIVPPTYEYKITDPDGIER